MPRLPSPGGDVTPRDIYNELLRDGASTIQAIGIMANMQNESDFDPEAEGDKDANGTPTSFGLVQEHGSQYAGLVTGNPAGDMRAQIRLVAKQGGFRAASGSTPAEAAGNFAANYEKCVGCQPGGDQNSGRQQNAATVAGWVRSGKWPTSAGSSGGGGGGGGGQTAAASSNTCLISFPSAHLVFFTLGGGCILSKSAARAFIGALLLGVSVPLGLGGVLVVAAGMGLRSGSGQQLLQSVPGAGPVARVAGKSARQRRGRARAAGQADERELEARGATEIRRGQPRPRQDIPRSRTPTGPGRKTGTLPGPRDLSSEDKPPF